MTVLKYVIDGIKKGDEPLLYEKSEKYFSETLRGEVMTWAESLRQEGEARVKADMTWTESLRQ